MCTWWKKKKGKGSEHQNRVHFALLVYFVACFLLRGMVLSPIYIDIGRTYWKEKRGQAG